MTSEVMAGARRVRHHRDMAATPLPNHRGAGALLREWRLRRGRSQLELALDAGVSTRHLSYVETGRASPSAAMVMRLADELDVPLRDRNGLLLAAGYAPAYTHRDLTAPELTPIRAALDRLLAGHEPYPAIAVDRHWELIAANRGLAVLTEGAAAHLLAPPVNVLRLALHPEGVAPRIINLRQKRARLLDQLASKAAATGDPALRALHAELSALPGEAAHADDGDDGASQIAVPLRLRTEHGDLSFLSALTTFGAAADVTVAELVVESFFPADAHTAEVLQGTSTMRPRTPPCCNAP